VAADMPLAFLLGELKWIRFAHQIHFAIAMTSRKDVSPANNMVVYVIVGVLVLWALSRLFPVVTKAKATEPIMQLNQLYTIEQAFTFEHGRSSQHLGELDSEREKLIADGGQSRY
jgi:hypothetical protein